MTKFGYICTAYGKQITDSQRKKLKHEGCELLFEDEFRLLEPEKPGMNNLLTTISSGDMLIVGKLAHLGKGLQELINFLEELKKRGIIFRSLSESFDSRSKNSRSFYEILAFIAAMDEVSLSERIMGLTPKLTSEQWEEAGKLLASGESYVKVALKFNVNLSALYRKFPVKDEDEP